MPIVLPHKFKDGVGETASGVQVLENDETLKAAIEALENMAMGAVPAFANIAYNEEHEPSATQAALVVVSPYAGAGGVIWGAVVGGLEVARAQAPGSAIAPLTFPVPAGKKWIANIISGSFTAGNFFVSTTLLGRK